MIKLFRHIRKRLLNQSRVRKYLFYAIGEIILVVIGILIALQINNNNEQRKNNEIVANYLEQLNKEINQNITYLNTRLNSLQEDMANSHYYLSKLNTEDPERVQDSSLYNFIYQIGPINWRPIESSTFKDFNSSGYINLISDDTLKRYVFRIELQEAEFQRRDQEISETWDNQLLPFYKKHASLVNMRDSIGGFKMPQTIHKNNRAAFINNKELNNILMNRMMMSYRATRSFNQLVKNLTIVSDRIEKHLKNND